MRKLMLVLAAAGAFHLQPAQAGDERMEAYTDCWSKVATADIPRLSGKAYEDALAAAVTRANTVCNRLARHAARTNGKDAVNEMWRYMEIQFYNANMREQ